MKAVIRTVSLLILSMVAWVVAAFGGIVGGAYVSRWLGSIWPTDRTAVRYHMNPTHSVDTAFVLAVAALAFAAALSLLLLYLRPLAANKRRVMIYWIAFLFMLPLSGSNFASGDILFDVRAQAILDVLMVLFGATIAVELNKFVPDDTLLRVLRMVIIFLVATFGVLIPAVYFCLFALAAVGLSIADLSNGTVSALAALTSAVIAFLNYRHSLLPKSGNVTA